MSGLDGFNYAAFLSAASSSSTTLAIDHTRSEMPASIAGRLCLNRPHELGSNPDVVGAAVERVIQLKLRATIFVVAHECHRPSDHRNNRALILFGQSVQKRRRAREENDLLTDVRPLVFTGHKWSRF
jgi:hypothetical protein